MGKITPVMRQYLAVTCFSLLAFSYGNAMGWGTINFVELQQKNTTYPTGPFSMEEATFVATAMCIGGFLGNFGVLPVSQRFGQKGGLFLIGIPLIVSYLLLIFVQNKYWVYISRILSGFGGGASMIATPLLIAEISHDNVRGSLNSLFDPANNLGVALSMYLGNYFNAIDQAKILMFVPIIFMMLAVFLPDTPEFWIQRNKQNRAEKSQKFYKGKEAVANIEALLSKAEEINEKPMDIQSDNATLSDYLSREAKRAICISSILFLFSLLTGNLIVLNFVTAIFVETGSSLSPNISSILVIAIQITANLIVLNIVDRINRRTMLMISSIVTAVGYFIFGLYCMFYARTSGLDWLPPLLLATITFSGCMGVIPIPYIIIIEILPPKIRSTCLAVIISVVWLLFFAVGSLYPIMQEEYGIHTCLFLFGSSSSLLAVYTYYFMPETLGKSSEEIMEILRT